MEEPALRHCFDQRLFDYHEGTVLVARVIEEMSVEETADLLGIRRETVKTRLHRARGLLKEALEKRVGSVLTDAFPFEGQRCERMTSTVLRRLALLV